MFILLCHTAAHQRFCIMDPLDYPITFFQVTQKSNQHKSQTGKYIRVYAFRQFKWDK